MKKLPIKHINVQRFAIPAAAVKYILFQRTQYLKWHKNLFLRTFSKLFYTKHIRWQKRVEIEGKLRKKAIKNLYFTDMMNEFLEVKDYLPIYADAILDIGCGIAGIDKFLHDFYKNENLKLFLLDKTKIENEIYYLFEKSGAFYNSLDLSKKFLMLNKIPEKNIYLLEANDECSVNIQNIKLDLIISLISWGFHYPVHTYINQVYDLLKEGGVLILDIRKDTSGISEIQGKFGNFQVISETPKKVRIKARKQTPSNAN